MKPRREWTAEQDAQIVGMRGQGVAFNQIGKRIGAPPSTVADRYFELIGRPVRPAAKAVEDREHRQVARHRTLVGALMGDPPIGFSALDRRSAQ